MNTGINISFTLFLNNGTTKIVFLASALPHFYMFTLQTPEAQFADDTTVFITEVEKKNTY